MSEQKFSEIIPAAPDKVADGTKRAMMPLWIENLCENLHRIRAGCSLHELPKRSGPCIVVGAGPSLKKLKHLEMIRKAGWKHTVLCCDKVLGDCLSKGVLPYAVASIDASESLVGFYTKPAVQKYGKGIHGVFSVFTHPKVIETWYDRARPAWWYTPMMDLPKTAKGEWDYNGQSFLLYLLTKGKTVMAGIGNVGSFLWNMAVTLGCEPIILIGFDFSEQVLDKTKAVYFPQFAAGFYQQYKDEQKACDAAAALHQLEYNPDFIATFSDGHYFREGKNPRYLVNPIWKSYRKTLALNIAASKKLTINATGNGCLHTQATWKDEKGNEVFILKNPYFKAEPLEQALGEWK